MNSDAAEQSRKDYHSPVFHVYGGIRDLTQSFGLTGNTDGGVTAGFTKTAL